MILEMQPRRSKRVESSTRQQGTNPRNARARKRERPCRTRGNLGRAHVSGPGGRQAPLGKAVRLSREDTSTQDRHRAEIYAEPCRSKVEIHTTQAAALEARRSENERAMSCSVQSVAAERVAAEQQRLLNERYLNRTSVARAGRRQGTRFAQVCPLLQWVTAR